MSNHRVLVVGTTSDYIHLIRSRFPGRALFITAAPERAKATEPHPAPGEELLADLTRPHEIPAALERHLQRWSIRPAGVTCFDCESLALASLLARILRLPYPSADSIAACRSKLICKQLWLDAHLPCPQARLVHTPDQAADFLRLLGRPAILKPLTGSGSELLFVCSSPDDCARAFPVIRRRLAQHPDTRMYAPSVFRHSHVNPREAFVIEELLLGTEYSADFIVDAGRVDIIRIARKIPATDLSVGTTLAYLLPADLPPPLDAESVRRQLLAAARALGIDRAICMLDFIVQDGQARMIELAPRPGGDCLPWLILRSSGLDVLGLALDFAERRPIRLPPPTRWRPLVGLRLFAPNPGLVRRIETEPLAADPRVLEIHLTRGPGHRVVLPPEDYDSRLLGHLIFAPSHPDAIEHECLELNAKLRLEMEPHQ